MNRALDWINLLGVILLAVLCALQWRANRALNLDVNRLEKTRQTQSARLDEQAAILRGLTSDLDRFRAQLGATTLNLTASDAKLRASEHLAAQLTRERDQLKESIARWTAAVALRDDRLRDANASIHDLGTRLNESIASFNALVARYNAVVRPLNEARAPQPAAP